MLTIGLAMLQGSRHEHRHSVRRGAAELGIEVEVRELRKASDVEGIHGLILPGGESTAMRIASTSENLYDGLWNVLKNENIPVLGTCAGAILLSQNCLIETSIERNAFGRQKYSFQSSIKVELKGNHDYQ